jgi:hypothetical protein
MAGVLQNAQFRVTMRTVTVSVCEIPAFAVENFPALEICEGCWREISHALWQRSAVQRTCQIMCKWRRDEIKYPIAGYVKSLYSKGRVCHCHPGGCGWYTSCFLGSDQKRDSLIGAMIHVVWWETSLIHWANSETQTPPTRIPRHVAKMSRRSINGGRTFSPDVMRISLCFNLWKM